MKDTLFDPIWRIPVVLAKYQGGMAAKHAVDPPVWLQVAVESGLVQMYRPYPGEQVYWLEQIDPMQVIEYPTHEEVQRMIDRGTLDALDKITEEPNDD